MDSVTHVVLGAAMGELIAGRQAGRKAMIWGALAASAPDVDVITTFFTDNVGSLVTHRGITHSLFTAVLAAPLLGYWFFRMFRSSGVSLQAMIGLFLAGLLSHDLLDSCTIYGTELLAPFTTQRYALNNIFVADPVFTLPLLIAPAALAIANRNHPNRRKWAAWGLLVSCFYLAWTFVAKSKAEDALDAALKKTGVGAIDHFTAPTLLNSVAWNLVAKTNEGYWIGYYSVIGSQPVPVLYFQPRNDSLLASLAEHPDVGRLKTFSQGYYCITMEDDILWFNDLRFGQVDGWVNPKAPYAFRFDLSEDADNSLVVQRGRIEGSKREVLSSLWHFIRQ